MYQYVIIEFVRSEIELAVLNGQLCVLDFGNAVLPWQLLMVEFRNAVLPWQLFLAEFGMCLFTWQFALCRSEPVVSSTG